MTSSVLRTGTLDSSSDSVEACLTKVAQATARVPDLPVGRFTVNVLKGSRGLIQNNDSLCGARKKATAQVAGETGRATAQRAPLKVSCCKGSNARKAQSGHKNRRIHR